MTTANIRNENPRNTRSPRPQLKDEKRHAAIERWLRREPLGRNAPGSNIWFH